jgi:hypothetical protein
MLKLNMDNQFAPQTPQVLPPQQPAVYQPQPLPPYSGRRFKKTHWLILLSVLVFVGSIYGVYVWQHGKVNAANAKTAKLQSQVTSLKTKVNKLSKLSGASAQVAASTQQADPTADWIAYTSSTGKFSLKYPKTWAVAAHPELCAADSLLVAPTAASVGKCGSESVGEGWFSFSSSQACYPLDSSMYSGLTTESVTAAGVQGTKRAGVSKDTASQGIGGLPAGIKAIQYCFDSGNKHFTASYQQLSGYPDGSSDFNTIVTKTFKFN